MIIARKRNVGIVLATLLILPATLPAQRSESDPTPSLRSTSVVTGVGNSMGWFGVQGEKYLRNDRVSLSGGVGYAPRGSRELVSLVGLGFGYTWRR